jgi:16S rRNA (cytidine1402-2'-O)-methyltransferase
MEDITLRAIRTLKEVSLIAAEDTRHTRKLLSRYEIGTRLTSYHDHNKEKRSPGLLKKLKSGNSIALVTDAGTPSISDPGHYLVRAAIHESIPVVPIPGPSALVAALSVSGFPTDSFVFVGFPPRKSAKRKRVLRGLKEEPRTLVFYESPKRLIGFMREMTQVMGDRSVVVARELTKIHEEIIRGPLTHVLETLGSRPSLKGEYTLLVEGYEGETEFDHTLLLKDLKRMCSKKDRPLGEVAKELSEKYGLPKKFVYQEGLKLKK